MEIFQQIKKKAGVMHFNRAQHQIETRLGWIFSIVVFFALYAFA
jgi:hypothetical protein